MWYSGRVKSAPTNTLTAMKESLAEMGNLNVGSTCDICGTKKRQTDVDTPAGRVTVWAFPCDCWDEENEQARRKLERQRQIPSYDIGRSERIAGYGEDSRNKTLGNYVVHNEKVGLALECFEAFPSHEWLDATVPGLLEGKRILAIFDYPPREGRHGKTHLLCGIYNRWREEGRYPVYLNWSHYLSVRMQIMSDDSLVSAYSAWLGAVLNPNYPLVIDDWLKMNVNTPWAAEIAYNLLDSRLRSGASIVLASNIRLDDRASVVNKLSRLGEQDEFAGRVHQRLRENCLGIDCTTWKQFGREQSMQTLR